MAVAAGIGQKHADLSIFDASGCSTILACYACGHPPLFEKAGFIYDDHRFRIAQVVRHVCLQGIADGINVPHRASQEMLEAVGFDGPDHFRCPSYSCGRQG